MAQKSMESMIKWEFKANKITVQIRLLFYKREFKELNNQ